MKIDGSWYERSSGKSGDLGAGGVIVRWEHDRLMVVLVREGGFLDYILPKGKVEAGEALETAAEREIAEEAGVTGLERLGKLGVRERMDARKRSWKVTHYYLFYTSEKITQPTDRNHSYQSVWFPIDRLPSMFWPDQQELIETNRQKIIELASKYKG